MSDDGFLSRWSQRKRESKTQAPAVSADVPASNIGDENTSTGEHLQAKVPENTRQSDTLASTVPANRPPLPSLDSLTAESDFSPFMATEVAPALRNEAMKKLFADPHYNIMDGLDTYIDDYGKPDPLPAGWLEQMQQSKSLRLFETEEEKGVRERDEATGDASSAQIEADVGAPLAADAAAAPEEDAANPPALQPSVLATPPSNK